MARAFFSIECRFLKIDRQLRLIVPDETERNAIVGVIGRRTRRILDEHWSAVQIVATELINRRRLSGRRFAELAGARV